MVSLDEWHFEFEVTGSEPIPRQLADDLLCVEVIEWAEAHLLGIGGGYRPGEPEIDEAAQSWRFQFGLCIQHKDQSIPESQAGELLILLQSWCEARGLAFRGGFRAFTPKE